jgi:hypothetical protein
VADLAAVPGLERHPRRRAGALCNRPVRRTAASLLSA